MFDAPYHGGTPPVRADQIIRRLNHRDGQATAAFMPVSFQWEKTEKQ